MLTEPICSLPSCPSPPPWLPTPALGIPPSSLAGPACSSWVLLISSDIRCWLVGSCPPWVSGKPLLFVCLGFSWRMPSGFLRWKPLGLGRLLPMWMGVWVPPTSSSCSLRIDTLSCFLSCRVSSWTLGSQERVAHIQTRAGSRSPCVMDALCPFPRWSSTIHVTPACLWRFTHSKNVTPRSLGPLHPAQADCSCLTP